MQPLIQIRDLGKQYRLGEVSTGTLSHDLNRWWYRLRGREDPYLKLGEVNDRTVKGTSEYAWALRDISFDVMPGDVLGIIGRNGAGKSTLLKILSRTTAPSTGQIKIKGRVASLLEVGTGFHPELTGRENIYLNGAIMGMSRKEISSQFDEIVAFAELERYVDTPVKRYSSGMYVRLAFAVAAHLESEILIVDEVLAVGDLQFQQKSLGKMEDVSRNKGKTILFVSHNLTTVANICTKGIILKNGEMDFSGSIDRAVSRYMQDSTSGSAEGMLSHFLSHQQDEVFTLSSVRVYQNDNTTNHFVNDQAITVEIGYEVKKDVFGLRIGFDLIDKVTFSPIFRSFHDDGFQEINKTPAGRYSTRFSIEPNLLKDGEYFIGLAIGIHKQRWIIHDSLRFEFEVSNLSGINRLYADQRPGVIMPKLEISTETW